MLQKNARYTSKSIQNELIKVVGDCIRSEIVEEVRVAKFFSVIADEVTDISNKEQLSISFRYVFDNSVKEVFIDFIAVERITGKALSDAIMTALAEWGVPMEYMRGQCYDGASSMSGARSGCSALIKEKAPLAVYHHCAAHRLNLAIVSACQISSFKNTESYIGEMARFFKYSAKRQRLLDKVIDSVCPSAKAKKLKDACRTRWIQHIDSYVVFLELLPAVHATLQAMISPTAYEEYGSDWNWDSETLTKATGYIFQLQSSSFLVCFHILLECLTHLRGISIKLQMQAGDVLYAYKEIKTVLSSLKSMRDTAAVTFSRIFREATSLGKCLHGDDFELKQPRLNARQVHRFNVQTASAEEYFRISLFNEYFSHVISELEVRFTNNPAAVNTAGLLELLPEECRAANDLEIEMPRDLVQAREFYSQDLPHPVMLHREYQKWVLKWKEFKPDAANPDLPKKLIDVFKQCDAVSYPNLHVLLQLALTLPITSCECERSFSQLKLIKTSHRSTTSSERLSGLALMKINRSRCDRIYHNPAKLQLLVKKFSQLHPRRMKLSFVLTD